MDGVPTLTASGALLDSAGPHPDVDGRMKGTVMIWIEALLSVVLALLALLRALGLNLIA